MKVFGTPVDAGMPGWFDSMQDACEPGITIVSTLQKGGASCPVEMQEPIKPR